MSSTDRKVLALPANACVDDLPVGAGGTWEWIYEVAEQGRAGRLDFAGYGRRSTADELERRAGVLRCMARSLELTAALRRLDAGGPSSPQELAGLVKRAAEAQGEPVHGVSLVCGSCGCAYVGDERTVDCPHCSGPVDPAVAHDRAKLTDPTPLPPEGKVAITAAGRVELGACPCNDPGNAVQCRQAESGETTCASCGRVLWPSQAEDATATDWSMF